MKIERKFSSKKDFDNFKDFVKRTLTSKGIKDRDIDHYYSVVDRVGKKDLEVFMLLTSLLFNPMAFWKRTQSNVGVSKVR